MPTFLKNKEQSLKNICLFIIYLVPFTLLFYGGTVYPFIIPKALAFIFLVDVLIIFYCLLVKLNPSYLPRLKNSIFLAIFIYFTALLFSSIFGQNFSKSFWGTLDEADGLILLLHLLVFIVIILALFKKKQWLILLEISVFVSFLASLLSVKELIGARLSSVNHWIRIESVFGNPLYFSHFLLFNIFFAFFLLTHHLSQQFTNKSPKEIKRFFKDFLSRWQWRFFYYLLIIILELFLIIATQTRGAFLGLIFGILVMIIISLIAYSNKTLRRIILILLLASVILAVIVMVNLDNWQFLQIGPLKRLTSFSLTSESSISRRILIWEASLKSYPSSWLLGWGWGNFDYAYLAHFPPQLMEDEGSASWFRNAHNIIIEHLIIGGVIGVSAYIYLLFIILINWFKAFKDKKRIFNRFSLIIIISLIAADFIFNLFAFYSIASYILFFITLGLLISVRWPGQLKLNEYRDSYNNFNKVFIFGILLFALISLFFYVKPTFSIARKLNLALSLEKQGQTIAAKKLFYEAAIKSGYQQVESVIYLDRFVKKWAPKLKPQEQINFLQEAIKITEPLVERDLHNLYLTNELLILYEATFPLENKYFLPAQNLATKTQSFFPTCPLVYNHLGTILLAQKKSELALEQFQKMIELDPKISMSYWLALKPAILLGKMELVDQYLKEIETIEHPDPVNNPTAYTSSISLRPERMRELANNFANSGYYQRAIQTLEDLLEMEDTFSLYEVESPNEIDILAQLAANYAAFGQDAKAKEITNQLLLLDPGLEWQAEKFLKELEAGALRRISK